MRSTTGRCGCIAAVDDPRFVEIEVAAAPARAALPVRPAPTAPGPALGHGAAGRRANEGVAMSQPDPERSPARDRLDEVVVNIELTLISIIQGLALAVLAGASVQPILQLQWQAWPYIL